MQEIVLSACGNLQTVFCVYQLKVCTSSYISCESRNMGESSIIAMAEEVLFKTVQGECTTEDLGGLNLLQLRLLMGAARVIDSCLGTDKVDHPHTFSEAIVYAKTCWTCLGFQSRSNPEATP